MDDRFAPQLAAAALRAGWIDATQLALAKDEQRRRAEAGTPISLGKLLVDRELISAEQLAQVERELLEADTLAQPAEDPTTVAAVTGDALVGRTLEGRYELLRKIGQGGMGAVYEARHLGLDRVCAVKILPPEMAGDPGAVARFRREARATAALDEPHVVTVHDVGEDHGLQYLAMELVRGESLAERAHRGPVDWRDAVDWIRQAALGLEAAHGAGIYHRDVKPQNLMLGGNGVVKVMDFGLARLAEATSQLSSAGLILGTPHYMSPEQARGEPVGAGSDVFSLGATLYVLLGGRLAFGGPTPAVVIHNVIHQPHVPLAELRGDLPAALCQLVDQALTKDRALRLADMRSFQRGLQALLEHGASRRRAGRRLALAAGALGIVAVALGLWVRARRGPPAPAPGPPPRPTPSATTAALEGAVLAGQTTEGLRLAAALPAGEGAERALEGLAMLLLEAGQPAQAWPVVARTRAGHLASDCLRLAAWPVRDLASSQPLARRLFDDGVPLGMRVCAERVLLPYVARVRLQDGRLLRGRIRGRFPELLDLQWIDLGGGGSRHRRRIPRDQIHSVQAAQLDGAGYAQLMATLERHAPHVVASLLEYSVHNGNPADVARIQARLAPGEQRTLRLRCGRCLGVETAPCGACAKAPSAACAECKGSRTVRCPTCSGVGAMLDPWEALAAGVANQSLGAGRDVLARLAHRIADRAADVEPRWRPWVAQRLRSLGFPELAEPLGKKN